jgi:pimeloyl-ACP methyl ester carboxylesterase
MSRLRSQLYVGNWRIALMKVANSSQLRIVKRVFYFGRSTMKTSFGILSALPLLVASFCAIAGSPQLKTVEVNGTELTYIEDGRGAPVVFVHGAIADYRYWESQRDAIAQKYRFVAYSMRYHEPNRWQDDGTQYSIPTHVADLAGFIRSLKAGPVHLVGLSYGGAIAGYFAIDHQDLIKTLTLADASVASMIADLPEAKSIFAERSQMMSRAKEAIKNGGDLEGAKVLLNYALGENDAYDSDPQVDRELFKSNAKTLGPLISAKPPPPIDCAKAATIRVPTLVLAGDRTLPYFQLVDAAWARCIRGSESVTIPGADHIMNVRNPHAFNEALLTFFAGHQ